MQIFKLGLALAGLCSCLSAQRIVSIGVQGGVPFTSSFADRSFTPLSIEPYVGSVYGVHSYSTSNHYVIGPAVELHLPLNFSIEAGALFRPLTLTSQYYVIGPGPEPPVVTRFNSWEIPVLARYGYRGSNARFIEPFVEAGPTFRALTGSISDSLSKAGFVGGVGLEVKLWKMHVEPEVRYTHWGKDTGRATLQYLASEQNQGEFLVGLFF